MYEAVVFIILTVFCILTFLIGQLVHKDYTRKNVISIIIMLCLALIGYASTFSKNERIGLLIPTIILITMLIFVILKYGRGI